MAALAAALLAPKGADAANETRRALILGYGDGAASADALAVSRAALAAGFEVRRIDRPASLPPLPVVAQTDQLLVYVAGASPDATPGALIEMYGPARTLGIVIETCGDGYAPEPALEIDQSPDSVLIALSETPDAACGEGRVTEALIAALAGAPGDLAGALSQTGLPVAVGSDWERSASPLTDSPSADPLIIAAPAPVTFQPTAATSGVQVFRAAAPAPRLPAQDRSIRPVAPGYPDPSVIVGEGVPDPARPAESQPDQIVSGETLGIDYAERERIRAEDPALFRRLMESGGFDPDAEQMAAAIQAELQRLDCYGSGVDGVWGNGSRQAVDRYFTLVGARAPGREPDAGLFRAIAGGAPDLRCPPVVVQPAVVSSPRTQRVNSQPSRAAQQPARSQPSAPSGDRQINPRTLGTGIFR